MTSPRTILSLCDFTGAWSQPYADAGYSVIRVDLQQSAVVHGKTAVMSAGHDVRLVEVASLPKIHGILAAPPCQMFAASGARWQRSREDMIDALSIVDASLRFVAVCRPRWWALENPVGKLSRYLGAPRIYFQPCDFGGYLSPPGDAYTKKTGLWGDFTLPKPRRVEPTEGSKMWKLYGGKSMATKNARSATPQGFARAFFEANP